MAPQDLEGLICDAIERTAAGAMAPGVLTALASGVRAYVVIREAADVEQRLDALETAAGIGEGRGA